MKVKTALLFAGAQITDYSFYEAQKIKSDIVICCDSGMHHTKVLGIRPDYIVGDFDSVNPEVLEEYKREGIEVYQFPAHKDRTDLQIGIALALEKGATDLTILGGIGSRFDHTLANAHLLYGLLKRGIRARLVNENNAVQLIDKELIVKKESWVYVSLIPLSMKVSGVTLTGFAYPLTDYTLHMDEELLAVSNELIAEEGRITITDGYLFVICSKD